MISADGDAAGCPVCRMVSTADVCPYCGWTLRTHWRAGPASAAARQRFTAELADACGDFDLDAALRAAGHPGPVDDGVFAGLQAHLRGGPVSEAHRAARVRLMPLPADTRDEYDTASHMIEIDQDGVCLSEGTRTQASTWTELFPQLASDEDMRRFQLAGGIGVSPTAGQDLRAAVAAGLVGFEGGQGVLLVCHTADWLVPRLALEVLTERYPSSRVVRTGRGRRLSLSITTGRRLTAAAVTAGLVAAGDGTGHVMAWQLPEGRQVADSQGADTARVTAVACSGRTIVTADAAGVVRAAGRQIAQHPGWVAAVRAHTSAVVSVGDDGEVRVTPWDPDAVVARRIVVGRLAASALAVSDDGMIAVGGDDQTLRLHDLHTGTQVGAMVTSSPIRSVAFGRQGAVVAAGCADGTVRVWRTVGQDLGTLRGLTGAVTAVDVPGVGQVVAGDNRGTIAWWPGRRLAEQPVLVGSHEGPVRAVGIDADGRLISVGGDGLIRAWTLRQPTTG
ncbi:hypothetical protein AB0B66_33995 [Catellatospora sp. NPDC049111]|uniref:WD40 repeat domain-containing protein n=1 Tax=Catellatospora sp. NPDC049111 TaxID=3155271 RepID=UPI0033C1EC01